ncbi:MAG: response regulator [Deltaproteobacteria bacterium]|nr:response regulator [Deltaproteobacteria bacterium]
MPSDQLLQLVFATAHQAIAILDDQLRFVRVNQTYAAQGARPVEFFPGKRHFDLYPHAENEAIFRRVLATGEPFTVRAKPFEYPDQPERGTTWWDWTLDPIRGPDGRVTGLLLQLAEVTPHVVAQQRAVEAEARAAQAEKLEAVGLLAASVAHDVNNALTAILACAGMVLQDEELPERVAEDVHAIRDSAVRAGATTARMLAFSRRQVLQPRVVNLATLVAEMAVLQTRSAGERVRVVQRLDQDAPAVRVDPAQLETALTNLITNAVDAMRAGGGTLELIVQPRILTGEDTVAPPGRYSVLTVKDNGMGMDKATQKRAFEPFFTTKGPRGTGLGLPSVWGFVSQSGAFLSLDSAPGVGTSVSILFPAVEGRPDSVEKPGALPRRVGRVLLVDDDEGVRKAAQRLLTSAGHTVAVAASGQEAWEALDRDGFDVLITDLHMPGMQGGDLARRALARFPALRVVFISGYAEGAGLPDPEIPAALVAKPFDVTTLSNAVANVLATGAG